MNIPLETVVSETREGQFTQKIIIGNHVLTADEPIINGGKDYSIHNCGGMLQTQLRCFLLNYNIKPLTLWMSRHGESEWNTEHRIGGNPDLSPQGQRYAKALGRFGMRFIGKE